MDPPPLHHSTDSRLRFQSVDSARRGSKATSQAEEDAEKLEEGARNGDTRSVKARARCSGSRGSRGARVKRALIGGVIE